jgi:hypothetical protein
MRAALARSPSLAPAPVPYSAPRQSAQRRTTKSILDGMRCFYRSIDVSAILPNMALVYATGEDIREGDQIVYDDLPGEIELVADPESPTDQTDWYISEYGGGVSVTEPTVFGRLFLAPENIDERLVVVSRKAT